MDSFSADSLESAFGELSAELRFSRAKAHVYIIGGAAITMAVLEPRRPGLAAVGGSRRIVGEPERGAA